MMVPIEEDFPCVFPSTQMMPSRGQPGRTIWQMRVSWQGMLLEDAEKNDLEVSEVDSEVLLMADKHWDLGYQPNL